MKHYKISVIVPVYNAEKYLRGCLRSLKGQTIRKRELEVLLVDDGSSDGSAALCARFCAKHPWARLITQANGGPSAARNTGIRQATGRYIMYLDADDRLSPDSARALRDFFAAHEDETDLVTYPLVREQGGRRMPRHYRYSQITRMGVYDCGDVPYFAQGSINVCVRNLGENNILFEPDRFHHEDETYVTANLARRWRIGFAADAEYWYNKDNDGSIMATRFHAYYIFEENLAWFEGLFAAHPGPPLYVQGLLLNDIEWKLRNGLLFPWHYEGEAFARAMERLRALLRRVTPEMLDNHPQMPKDQKAFWREFILHAYSKEELTLALLRIGAPAKRKPRKPPGRRLWLYYDSCPNGNAWLQYQHDRTKDDGVRRLYFSGGAKGGVKHLWAYLRYEWVLSSSLDFSPFAHQKLERLAEKLCLRWRLAWLQEGVHQFTEQPALYADKIVVSGPEEAACFRDIYGYDEAQLIPAGLARYDVFNREEQPQNRLLFAPEGRSYLLHNNKPALERARASDYILNIQAFLRACDVDLDVYLRPEFAGLAALFDVGNPHVHLLQTPPAPTDYCACVTDISSIAYDFAVLGRYVQYFLPDAAQFHAGMHVHRAFDLPQRFGPHSETPGEAIAQLREAAGRGFAVEREYLQKMQEFFYALEDGRETVYREIMG